MADYSDRVTEKTVTVEIGQDRRAEDAVERAFAAGAQVVTVRYRDKTGIRIGYRVTERKKKK